MKHRHLLITTFTLALAACDQSSKQEARQLAEERAALAREKSELAAQKAAAQQAANGQERAEIKAERAALAAEKAKLSADRDGQAAAERSTQLADERSKRMTAERDAATEAAARQDAEVREREARLVAEQSRIAAEQAAEAARGAEPLDFFYEALDPHGDWVQLERYGYAFRPNAARDPRWRPYTDGGWVFTDYGWTWRTEEPFGWATYHYGRWARAPRVGWVWIPGAEWGPAWVSWRRSNDYIGWAPLPPDAWSASGFNAGVDSYYDIGPGLYVFLRVADFGEPSYRGRVVEPEQNVTIVNQTVNVTNIMYQKVQNKMTVVNNGPDIAVINQASRRPVQRLAVQRVATTAPQPVKVEGNVLRLAAPVFKNARAAAKPKAVKEEVKATELEHGWRDAKNDEQKLREAAKNQARRAEEAEFAPPQEQPAPGVVPARPAPIAPASPPQKRTSTPAAARAEIAPPSAKPITPAPLKKQSLATPVAVRAKATPPESATPAPPQRPLPPRPGAPRPDLTPSPAVAPTPKPVSPNPKRVPPATAQPETPLPREPKPLLKQFRKPTPNPTPSEATPKKPVP